MAVYCTLSDLQKRAGADAVTLRLDDGGDASAATCISDASADVDLYLYYRYDPARYAANRWVNKATAIIALVYLCERRFNSVPASLQKAYDRLVAVLEAIQAGLKGAVVPGLAPRKASVPVISQPRARLFPVPGVVTERGRSTGTPAGYSPVDDWFDPRVQ